MDNNIRYNAFISYNHNPRDIEIAKELQKTLERYRIPKGIQASSKITKIDRVFLDVGELGVSADLNDTIKNALDNTDKLIVICSPDSKASQWVHKEVEHFLTKHSPDQILTVITDGEPKEVLPEQIMHQELVNEDGSITIVDKEPLSCDFREGIRNAKKTELPRLIAGIIGCRYDDLVQRQRQYKMRQMTISFAVIIALMAGATSYFIWSNREISRNLNNTFKEQSLSLAMQSEKALNNGDRIGAIKYALDALPKEDEERPIVPEAVMALSTATELYQAPSGQLFKAAREIISGRISSTDVIVDGNRHIFAAYTRSGDVYIFDADTGKKLAEDYLSKIKKNLGELGHNIQGFKLLENGRIILTADSAVSVNNYNNEESIWVVSQDDWYGYDPQSISVGKNSFVITAYKLKSDIDSDGMGADRVIRCFDLETGEVKADAIIPKYDKVKKDDLTNGAPIINKTVISPDGSTATILGFYYTENKYLPFLYSFNLTSGEMKRISCEGIRQIEDVAYRKDGSLIVCGFADYIGRGPEANEFDGEDFENDWNSKPLTTTRSKKVVLNALQNNDLLWKAEYEEIFSSTPVIATSDNVSYDKPIIITGSKIREFSIDGKNSICSDAQSKVIYAWRSKIEGGKDKIDMILYDGSLASRTEGDNYLAKRNNNFPGPVEECVVMDGALYMKCLSEEGDGRYRILKYDNSFDGDPKWKAYDLREEGSDYSYAVAPYKKSFIECWPYGDREYLQMTDAKSGKTKWKTEIKRDNKDNIFKGLDSDNGRLLILSSTDYDSTKNTGEIKMQSVDLETGSISDIDIVTDREIEYAAQIEGITKEGKPFLLESGYSDNGKTIITSIDITNKNISTTEIEGEREFTTYRTRRVFDPDHEVLALLDENNVGVFGIDGKQICEIKDLPFKVLCAAIGLDHNLYIIGEESRTSDNDLTVKMHCYDMKKGTEVKEGLAFDNSVLPEEESFYTFADMDIEDISDKEYLFRISNQGLIMDKKSGTTMIHLLELRAYNDEVGEFYIDYGHAPYRTVQEMITEAIEIIS